MSAQITRIQENLKALKLFKTFELVESTLEEASKNNQPYSDFLDQLLKQEVASKREKNIAMRTSLAKFPFIKTLESFEFDFQPSIDKKRIKDLAACRFIDNGENVIFLGPPGVGKTHLAIGLGMEAIRAGFSVYFINSATIISDLKKAARKDRLEKKLRTFSNKYRLLIIDEIGYLPFDQEAANLFFRLISMRYEKGSTIFTANKSYSAWGEIFGDPVIATAILDRILHHSITLNMKGESYRLRNRKRAGTPFTNLAQKEDRQV